MSAIVYGKHQFLVRDGETLLSAMLRLGIPTRSSCRGGTCQTCMMHCLSGELPTRAQNGLSDDLRTQNYFLPCVCLPTGDMVITDSAIKPATVNGAATDAALESHPLEPDFDLWHALNDGKLLTAILSDFYARVYADAQLAPYFAGFTQQRLVEKQYSFLQQAITGNKVYFGNRPRNAHHWMVISDALFEHREQIMLACMRSHSLAETWVARWLAIENYFRADIIKNAPIPRQVDGVELPLEGYEELVLDVGTICDGCANGIESGETVRYHVRRGTVYCARCQATNDHTALA